MADSTPSDPAASLPAPSPGAGGPHGPAQLELILQQLDSLPTLSPIAVRVLAMMDSPDADLRQIASAIEADPALTAKILSMCRRASLGIATTITTVDRAAVMLGLEAVQAALLSVEVYELFSARAEGDEPGVAPARQSSLDRRELWRHCLAVACGAELIAERHAETMEGFRPQEAFVAGLLHDLGKLALDAVLPRSFARVAELAETRQLNIAEVERRVLGLDHHRAGKRLAEHWGLPHALQDVIWLHGQALDALPDVPHRGLVSVVSAADHLARALHLGWSGNFAPLEETPVVLRRLGLDPKRVGGIERQLHARLAERSADLGLGVAAESTMLLESIARANRRLGRLAGLLEQRAGAQSLQSRTLDAIAQFHARQSARRTFTDAARDVVRSAREVLGSGRCALVFQTRRGSAWTVYRFSLDGQTAQHTTLERAPGGRDLADLIDPLRLGADGAGLLAWLSDRLGALLGSPEGARLMPLASGTGLTALLLHECATPESLATGAGVSALASTWGSALAAACQHDGARRLGEQLAEANRRAAEAQAVMIEARSMARLGEMAAGAAHEMNNPLTVISGQAQILSRQMESGPGAGAARSIVQASEKLTELITSLHLLAEPPAPARTPTDILDVLHQAARLARQRMGLSPDGAGAAPGSGGPRGGAPGVLVVYQSPIPPVWIDGGQIVLAVTELIVNALQAQPRSIVEVRVHIDPFDDRLMISVVDDGAGMSAHALEHAFDPFFSELPAGRRTGLGLTRARRFVDLHGGELVLESQAGKGTTARVVLSDWRSRPPEPRVADAA